KARRFQPGRRPGHRPPRPCAGSSRVGERRDEDAPDPLYGPPPPLFPALRSTTCHTASASAFVIACWPDSLRSRVRTVLPRESASRLFPSSRSEERRVGKE